MPIKIACPSCEAQYNLAESQLGKTVRCKDCGDTFPVRDRDEAPPPPPPPVARFAPRDDLPRPARGRDDYDDRPRDRRDDYDDRPRERRRDEEHDRPQRRERSGGSGVLIGVLVGGGVLILLLVVGVVLAIVLVSRSVSNSIAQIPNQPPPNPGFNPGFNPPPNFPGPAAPRPGFGGGNFPGMPPAGADWNRLRVGMTEAEVTAIFGEPAQRHDYENIHVIHAKVTMQEVMGQNGKTRPVRRLLYFKGAGQPGFMNITLVDGKVYKFWD